MDRYNDYITRKKNQIELAEKIKANVKKTKSFSDSELRIYNTRSLEADSVYNMLNFLEQYEGFLHKYVNYDGMEGISIESLVSAYPFGDIKRDIMDLEKRRMIKSVYNRLIDSNLRTFLRQEFQSWVEERNLLKNQTSDMIPKFIQDYNSAFGVEYKHSLVGA